MFVLGRMGGRTLSSHKNLFSPFMLSTFSFRSSIGSSTVKKVLLSDTLPMNAVTFPFALCANLALASAEISVAASIGKVESSPNKGIFMSALLASVYKSVIAPLFFRQNLVANAILRPPEKNTAQSMGVSTG